MFGDLPKVSPEVTQFLQENSLNKEFWAALRAIYAPYPDPESKDKDKEEEEEEEEEDIGYFYFKLEFLGNKHTVKDTPENRVKLIQWMKLTQELFSGDDT